MVKYFEDSASDSSEEIMPLQGNDATERRSPQRRLFNPIMLLSAIILMQTALLFFVTFYRVSPNSRKSILAGSTSNMFADIGLYSPVQDVVKYKAQVFGDAIWNKTIYQGDGPEADKAWHDLYHSTTIKISREEALRLPNKTYPIETEPGYYIGQLDVFHQLHCLDMLRMFFLNRTDETHEQHPDAFGDVHLSHCIDSLRQSIMCHSDISVIVWQWRESDHRAVPKLTSPHTCRNFDDIRDWSRGRRLKKYIDVNHFIADDLPSPPIIHS